MGNSSVGQSPSQAFVLIRDHALWMDKEKKIDETNDNSTDETNDNPTDETNDNPTDETNDDTKQRTKEKKVHNTVITNVEFLKEVKLLCAYEIEYLEASIELFNDLRTKSPLYSDRKKYKKLMKKYILQLLKFSPDTDIKDKTVEEICKELNLHDIIDKIVADNLMNNIHCDMRLLDITYGFLQSKFAKELLNKTTDKIDINIYNNLELGDKNDLVLKLLKDIYTNMDEEVKNRNLMINKVMEMVKPDPGSARVWFDWSIGI